MLRATFVVTCDGDATAVFGRFKDVFTEFLAHKDEDGIDDRKWQEVLPAWFLDKLRLEDGAGVSSNDAPAGFLSRFFRRRAKRPNELHLNTRLCWLDWDMRTWIWRNGEVLGDRTIRVDVIGGDCSFAWENLRWLFALAGARTVEYADV
jgi:hypothetical protein